MTVVNAQNIQDAQDAKLVNPAAHFVGGTVTAQGFELKDKPWIDVSKCPEMRHLELKEDGLHLGAALSLRELEASSGACTTVPLIDGSTAACRQPPNSRASDCRWGIMPRAPLSLL